MKKQKDELKWLEINEVGDHLQDFENNKLNRAMDTLMVLKGKEPYEVTKTLEAEGFTEVSDTDAEVFLCGVETTLKRANQLFKTMGLDLEFQLVDLAEHSDYMLVKTNDTPKTVAKRIHKAAGLPYKAPKQEKVYSPF
jgi:hypothetical protein